MPLQRKSATMILNEHKQRGHDVVYEEFECDGHTGHRPKYGCRVSVNGDVEGTSQDYPNKKAAKEEAARQAAESLILL
jgi:hypothetical protein